MFIGGGSWSPPCILGLSNYGENNVIIGERTYKCEEMELADEGFVG